MESETNEILLMYINENEFTKKYKRNEVKISQGLPSTLGHRKHPRVSVRLFRPGCLRPQHHDSATAAARSSTRRCCSGHGAVRQDSTERGGRRRWSRGRCGRGRQSRSRCGRGRRNRGRCSQNRHGPGRPRLKRHGLARSRSAGVPGGAFT